MGAKNGEFDFHAAASQLLAGEKSEKQVKKSVDFGFGSKAIHKIMGKNNPKEIRKIRDSQKNKGNDVNLRLAMEKMDIHDISNKQRGNLKLQLHSDDYIKRLKEDFNNTPYNEYKIALGKKIRRLEGIREKNTIQRVVNNKRERVKNYSPQEQRQLANLKRQLGKATLKSQKEYYQKEINKIQGTLRGRGINNIATKLEKRPQFFVGLGREFSPRTGRTLCSRTAVGNLNKLGVEGAPVGHAMNAFKSSGLTKRRGYSLKNLLDNIHNNPGDVVDLYLDASSKNRRYGHRVAGKYYSGVGLLVYDAYFPVLGSRTRQGIPAKQYFAYHNGKGRKFWGAKVYSSNA